MSTQTTIAVAIAALGMTEKFSLAKNMELSERKDEKQVKVGEITVLYPDLEAFGIQPEHDTKAESERKPSEILPIYSDARMQWLYDAVVARVEAQARSKTLKGKLKEGLSIPETFEDLTAVGERGGEFLKIKSESRKSFASYLESIKKPQTVVNLFVGLFDGPSSLVVSEERFVTAFKVHLGNWIKGLTDEQKARFTRIVATIQENLQGRDALNSESLV